MRTNAHRNSLVLRTAIADRATEYRRTAATQERSKDSEMEACRSYHYANTLQTSIRSVCRARIWYAKRSAEV
jgi:hypothetical protein